MELSPHEIQNVLQRFPQFETSYETVCHKNFLPDYHIIVGIPYGKKYFIWYSVYQQQNVCFFMELNRDKKITHITVYPLSVISKELAFGTILYASCIPPSPTQSTQSTEKQYIIEDIYMYKGHFTDKMLFSHKLGHLEDLFVNHTDSTIPSIYLPKICWNTRKIIASYDIHHIQHRSLTKIVPYLNENKKVILSETSTQNMAQIVVEPSPQCNLRPNFKKPQYCAPAVFEVSADVRFDMYHLWAFGEKCKKEYVGILNISNYKKSVFMNSIFRKIRENRNLDYIEESDTEEDFEDMRKDKYVNLKKRVLIECEFNVKFKRWVPCRVVDSKTRIVHISRL